jgi:hypothetical protein
MRGVDGLPEFDPKPANVLPAGCGFGVPGRWKQLVGCFTCFDGSAISAVEIHRPIEDGLCWNGKGGITSLDGGNAWSEDLASPALPGFTITRILTSPSNAQVVYATVANSNARHVFRSKDGGLSWTDVDRGSCRTFRITPSPFRAPSRQHCMSVVTLASMSRPMRATDGNR